MNRFSSIFGQILHLFSKREFFENVYATNAERGAKGFGCWDQFVAMLFCQLGQAHSLRPLNFVMSRFGLYLYPLFSKNGEAKNNDQYCEMSSKSFTAASFAPIVIFMIIFNNLRALHKSLGNFIV